MLTDEGQYIDVSLVDAGLAWTVWEAAAYFGKGEVASRNGTAHRVSAPYQGFETKDGSILVGAGNQKLWEKFCLEVAGKPDWLEDPLYETNSKRAEHVAEFEQDIEAVFAEQPSEHWLRLLEASGIPSGPIYSYDQTLADPHINFCQMVQQFDHPTAGTVKTLGFPAKLSETPGAINRPAPTLGQHNEEILKEIGFSFAEIENLEKKRVVL